uniref:Uncharacterized protein n=1 Tax=Picea sitchensis TaxID=3332 RepID=A9NZD3_PICSI|nr:unknown [Picea sitchensis]
MGGHLVQTRSLLYQVIIVMTLILHYCPKGSLLHLA